MEYHDKKFDDLEPILKDESENERYVLFPIKYHDIFKMYKKMSSVIWFVEEINFTNDIKDLDKLTDNEKKFIFHVLAFFAASDGIVMENIVLSFYDKVKVAEYRNAISTQMMVEGVHSECYSLLIDTYCRNDEKWKKSLFDAVNVYPAIKKKAEWAKKWIKSNECSFAQKLVAYVFVEGLFFAASFCAIYWVRERGLLPGFCLANDFIAKDESAHAELTCLMYQYIENKLSKEMVHNMVKEAVEIEREFIVESLPCNLIGMNSDLMYEYIKYIADWWLVSLGYDKLYDAKNPFTFTIYSSVEGKSNFFEKFESQYQRASINVSDVRSAIPDKLSITEDF